MAVSKHQKISGLSGNEIYCLSKLNMLPGQLCVGNSVVALGVGRTIGAGLSTLGGGEVTEITNLVHQGRVKALARMFEEAKLYGGVGITGVSFDLITHGTNLEFLAVGSTVHAQHSPETLQFTTAANGQQLYCQVDAGFEPRRFVFGNVAYSIGVGGNIGGAFRSMTRGEVPQYSKIFDATRHHALARITNEARAAGANAVLGIETTISPLMGAQEMIVVGTASHHPALVGLAVPVTSDLTNEELWNIVNLSYMPLRLVMGVSVYSLGLVGGIAATLKSLGGGEVSGLTEILYEARHKALARIEEDAERCGADEVIGVKTHVYDLGGGLVEFMAIGTAIKKVAGLSTRNPTLPPQAIIRDYETLVDSTEGQVTSLGARKADSAARVQGGPIAIIGGVIAALYVILKIMLGLH